MKRNLAQQAEDVEQLLRLRFSFFWQLWGGDGAASQGCLTGLPHRAASQGCLTRPALRFSLSTATSS